MMKILNKLRKATIEGIKDGYHATTKKFSAIMDEASDDSSQDEKSSQNRIDEISENELIRKILYYLSMPVSEALHFHSLESCISQIQKQKQLEGENLVFDFMKNKYDGLIRTVSENLTQGNKAISLHILQHIEENLAADRKNLLG